jgi:O-antigen ligase
MPEHLKALIVVTMLATVVFAVARLPACGGAMRGADFDRRRNLWFGVTAAVFLAHNFWIYIIVAGVLLTMAVPREANKLALYYFMLFAVPNFSGEITGLGVIKHFFTIDYPRLLSLTVLLPAFIYTIGQTQTLRFGSMLADKLLAGYLILQFLLMLQTSTFTNTLRIGVFYAFVDVFLPYYVASRTLNSLAQYRDALMSFAVAALVLAAIAAFEFARHWLLYASLPKPLDVGWEIANYMSRGDSLRAIGSTGHGIALGYVMAVALGVFLYVKRLTPRTGVWLLGLGLLVAGLLVPISRGPWMGAAAMLLVFIVTGPAPLKGFVKLGLLGLALVPLLFLSSAGKDIIDSLPFIGRIDEASASVLYRQRLLEISIQVILQNPLLGAYNYFYSAAFQELKQGQGMLDIVNSYLGVALGSGLLGLSLFSGFFIAAGGGIARALRRIGDRNDERHLLGRVLLAVLTGILVTIFTVSSISVIPLIYWSVAGLGVGYAHLFTAAAEPAPAIQYPLQRGLQPA